MKGSWRSVLVRIGLVVLSGVVGVLPAAAEGSNGEDDLAGLSSEAVAVAPSTCITPEGGSTLELATFEVRPSSGFGQCGICSDLPCKQTEINTNCWKREGMQTKLGTCQEVVYPPYMCSEDLLSRCTCMVGPVP